MADKENGALRAVAWSEICPWLAIFRTFRLAIGFRALLLGAVAALLTFVLWGFIARIFADTDSPPTASGASHQPATEWLSGYTCCPWRAVTDDMVPDEPYVPSVPSADEIFSRANPVFGPWSELSRPLWDIFHWQVSLRDLACLLLCGLAGLAVWAFFGGAITRIAAVQLASEERIGWLAALRFARQKWLSYFVAPLFPLVGIVLAAIPVAALGVILRADVGVLLVGVIWALGLLFALVMALLLLGLIFGWPLMWPTISAEGTDSFDALSRSYAYVYQRPLHYLFYAAVAAALGWLGWLLVQNFAAAVVALSYWAASWGSGAPRIGALMSSGPGVMPGGEPLSGIGSAGATLIHFWAGCVKLLAVGFIYAYFWSATTAIYFLLRRDVDATEMDEVFLDADESEAVAGLPPLKTDAAGAPIVADEAPPPAPPQSPQVDTEPKITP